MGELPYSDLEGCVDALYEIAGCESDEVLFPSSLAEQLFGDECIQRVPHMIASGALGRAGEQHYIAVRASIRGSAFEHIVGHELGHWILRREGSTMRNTELELACDFIGAAIQTRRRPFARGARGRERDFKQLALDFQTSETLVALRVGEVLNIPIAVIAPLTVRARGSIEWPDEQRLRMIARRGYPGIARVRLTDDSRRVALIADEIEAA